MVVVVSLIASNVEFRPGLVATESALLTCTTRKTNMALPFEADGITCALSSRLSLEMVESLLVPNSRTVWLNTLELVKVKSAVVPSRSTALRFSVLAWLESI